MQQSELFTLPGLKIWTLPSHSLTTLAHYAGIPARNSGVEGTLAPDGKLLKTSSRRRQLNLRHPLGRASPKRHSHPQVREPRSGFDTVCIEFMKKAGGQRIRIGCSGNFDFRKLFNLNGGRDRTRTCDLLRVKNSGSFHPFYLLLGFSTTWGVCFRSADIL